MTEETLTKRFEASRPRLHAVATRMLGSSAEADDVVQETWLTAVRRIRAFDPERGPFAAWLRGIAANVLRNGCGSGSGRRARLRR